LQVLYTLSIAISSLLSICLIVPTTAGTGSETTGTAILDISSLSFKTGIASRVMKPTLGIVDTLNTDSCPIAVHISAGLDVLGHSLESYTAIPYEFSFIIYYKLCRLKISQLL
jgi:hydroxyacid-oxoacid transhydrogenase